MPHIIVQYPGKSERCLPMLDRTLRAMQEPCYLASWRVLQMQSSQDIIILASPRFIFLCVHDSICLLPLCVSGLGSRFSSAKKKAALAAFVTLVSRRFLSRFSSGFRHHSLFCYGYVSATSWLHPTCSSQAYRLPSSSTLLNSLGVTDSHLTLRVGFAVTAEQFLNCCGAILKLLRSNFRVIICGCGGNRTLAQW